MSRTIGFVLLAVGVVLLIMGIIATQKTGEQVVSGVTGHFTDQTMWYILGGIALVIIGGVSSFRKK
jgi:LPXTG-motif cell wall-anchored protein